MKARPSRTRPELFQFLVEPSKLQAVTEQPNLLPCDLGRGEIGARLLRNRSALRRPPGGRSLLGARSHDLDDRGPFRAARLRVAVGLSFPGPLEVLDPCIGQAPKGRQEVFDVLLPLLGHGLRRGQPGTEAFVLSSKPLGVLGLGPGLRRGVLPGYSRDLRQGSHRRFRRTGTSIGAPKNRGV